MSDSKVTTFNFPVPQAARLASLMGMKSDMTTVINCCDRMILRYSGQHLKKSPFDIIGFTTPLDFLDWEALSTTACIRYARCFVSGVRKSLDPSLLSNAAKELFDLQTFMIDLRNKHIGHSVNAFEQNMVTVQVADDCESSQEIDGVGLGNTHSFGLTFQAPADLKELAEWWLKNIEEEITVERSRVLEIARKTPIEVIRGYGMPESISHAEKVKRMGKPRKQP